MKNKKITNPLVLVLLLSITSPLFSQNDTLKNPPATDKKYIMWVSPSKATHVYGLMFNVWPKDHGPYPKINGIEFNICPIGAFTPFLTALYSLDIGKMMNSNDDLLPVSTLNNFKTVNGLQVGLFNPEPTVINGLDISATGSFESVTNGVTLSAVRNGHYIINGLTVAAMGNSDYTCNGVQIALINSCKNLKGFQFGIWNKNQKRSLPFINWCFKTQQ